MSFFKKILSNLFGFVYNEDRAIDSLAGGPPQETISSEIGRHDESNPVAHVAAKVLDGIQKDHVENAEIDANYLDAAAGKAGVAEQKFDQKHP